MLSSEIIKYVDKSILCWLATSSKEGIPNVSPKEVFTHYKDEALIIANIASPNSVKNIIENSRVCVSFIDILVQKGYQLHGIATILKVGDDDFDACNDLLQEITKGKYPYSSITKIDVQKSKQILAPSYLLYPNTTEKDQIIAARKAYNIAADL